MEFKFAVNDVFRQPIVQVGSNLIPPGFTGDRRAFWDVVAKVSEVVNAMGEASATAQGLTKPITTADRLRNSEHSVYLLIDQNSANGRGAVTGMLKTGKKGLYVFDRNGQHYQVSPPCVLDFYVHESRQRTGLGKRLYEHMLKTENIEPVKMAIDRPSDKFLGFLNKHYTLNSPVKQMNNYVVFDGFFPSSPEKNAAVEVDHSVGNIGKKQSANGLQTSSYASPLGRYGAPRPPCSMGQIIHNQTSAIPKNTEPTGVESAPETNYQYVSNISPRNSNVTQSTPNVYYRSRPQKVKLDGLGQNPQPENVEQNDYRQQQQPNNWQNPNEANQNIQGINSSYNQQNQQQAQNTVQNQLGQGNMPQPQQPGRQIEQNPQNVAQGAQNVMYNQTYPHPVGPMQYVQPHHPLYNTQEIQNIQQYTPQHNVVTPSASLQLSPGQVQGTQNLMPQIQEVQNTEQTKNPVPQMQAVQNPVPANVQNTGQTIIQQQPQYLSETQTTAHVPQQSVSVGHINRIQQSNAQYEMSGATVNNVNPAPQYNPQYQANVSQQYQSIVPQNTTPDGYIPTGNAYHQNIEQTQPVVAYNSPQSSAQYRVPSTVQLSVSNPQSIPYQSTVTQNTTPYSYIPTGNAYHQNVEQIQPVAAYNNINIQDVVPQSTAQYMVPSKVQQSVPYQMTPGTTQSMPNTNVTPQYNNQMIPQQTVPMIHHMPQVPLHNISLPHVPQVNTTGVPSQYQIQNVAPQGMQQTFSQPNVPDSNMNQNQVSKQTVSQPNAAMNAVNQKNHSGMHTDTEQVLQDQSRNQYSHAEENQYRNNQVYSNYRHNIDPKQTRSRVQNQNRNQYPEHTEGNLPREKDARSEHTLEGNNAHGDMRASANDMVTFEYGYPSQVPDPETQVMEEKVNSSPKLERPRSLSIQLSEEQTEDKKNDDVESEVPPQETLVEEEVIEKLAISENGAENEHKDEEKAPTPGKKTPSHLTEQGFFDLKFYHNKLW